MTKASTPDQSRRTRKGGGGGGGGGRSKPKVASRCRHAASYKFDIAFDLFNIFLYVIARKVRKCPLSPFVTSNVLSCLVRMADILARLVQMADSLSAFQLTSTLFRTRRGKNSSFPATAVHAFGMNNFDLELERMGHWDSVYKMACCAFWLLYLKLVCSQPRTQAPFTYEEPHN